MEKFTVKIDGDACKACGYCKLVCKKNVFEKGTKFNEKGYRFYVSVCSEFCVGCMECFYACPDFAVVIGDKDETPV